MQKDNKPASGCIAAIILLLISPFSAIYRGFAFSKLWLWFVVHSFAVRPLGIAESIGLGYVVGFLTYQYHREAEDDRGTSEKVLDAVLIAILWPSFALFFGWIVKHWL